MRICEINKCIYPVFGTDKETGVGYCKSHQYKRTDIDRSSPYLKAIKKQQQAQKQNVVQKIRSLNQYKPNVEALEKNGFIEETKKQLWFKLIRIKLTGWCQCGCGNTSSKKSDEHYRSSCCHVFPQRLFPSVQFHPKNYIERAVFGGCHDNLDNQSMDKWPLMADWEHIKEIFHELAPELTDEERKTKFYTNFENLVYYGNIEGKKPILN